jgi:hypothetical protein
MSFGFAGKLPSATSGLSSRTESLVIDSGGCWAKATVLTAATAKNALILSPRTQRL